MLIRMFLVDSQPEGIRTLELSNSTVLCTIVPRHLVAKFCSRKEAGRPGVYLLTDLGPDGTDQPRLYVGEGDPVSERIRSHDAKKEFWDKAYVFTSKDNYLTKTQIKFLEHEVYQIAKAAARADLDNATIPTLPSIAEADQAEMTGFLATMRTLLVAIGVRLLESRSTSLPLTVPESEVYTLATKGATARMAIREEGYLILAGSTAVPGVRPSADASIGRMRAELLGSGIIAESEDGQLRFTRDARFDSPSGAAAAVVGGNANGRKLWKRGRKTLGEIHSAEA